MQLVRPVVLVFLGPQGSGKGTQSTLLAQELLLPRSEAGQLFRDEAKQDTPLGRAIKEKLDRGEHMTTDLWKPVIERELRAVDGSKGMIFDGFLRNPDQLAQYEQFRKQYHLPEAIIIHLKLTREQAIERLMKRGRADDTPELIEKRLAFSAAKIKDILDHFRANDTVIDIDADNAIEVVQQSIRDALKARNIIA